MIEDLFARLDAPEAGRVEPLADGAMVLRGFAAADAPALLAAVEEITAAAPWRHLETPGGFRMSVAMTNCGETGWVSDRQIGYRYQATDPLTGKHWPPMPPLFEDLARRAANAAGFREFHTDVCLINRYVPGARLTLHQDRDEKGYTDPIVSVSLGLPAIFMFGGLKRTDPTRRIRLEHGDVTVWGGPSRLAFHGVAPLAEGEHPLTGGCRINLTFRRAL